MADECRIMWFWEMDCFIDHARNLVDIIKKTDEEEPDFELISNSIREFEDFISFFKEEANKWTYKPSKPLLNKKQKRYIKKLEEQIKGSESYKTLNDTFFLRISANNIFKYSWYFEAVVLRRTDHDTVDIKKTNEMIDFLERLIIGFEYGMNEYKNSWMTKNKITEEELEQKRKLKLIEQQKEEEKERKDSMERWQKEWEAEQNSPSHKGLYSDEALAILETKANKGDVKSQLKLGRHYDVGYEISHSFEKRFYWYKKAAEQNCAEAQYWLAQYQCLYSDKISKVYWLRKAAENGYAGAQCELAFYYRYGWDTVKQNYKKAIYWLQKAADQGYAEAQYELACFYQKGKGIETNLEKAIYWLRKAAYKNNTDAQKELAEWYEKGCGVKANPKKALYWLNRVFEHELDSQKNDELKIYDSELLLKLGQWYEKGIGIEKNRAKALQIFTLLAEQGDAEIQFKIAEWYEKGYGTNMNPERAYFWYQKAADDLHVEAMFKVAQCYETGYGVKSYPPRAIYWYVEAAERGHKGAQFRAAQCFEKGIGVEKDDEKAAFWRKKAQE